MTSLALAMTFEIAATVLIFVGLLGATVFVVDYIRTADISNPFSQMLIALNGAIAIVLGMTLLRRALFVFGDRGQVALSMIGMLAFAIVDIALWWQWALLRRTRRAAEEELKQD